MTRPEYTTQDKTQIAQIMEVLGTSERSAAFGWFSAAHRLDVVRSVAGSSRHDAVKLRQRIALPLASLAEAGKPTLNDAELILWIIRGGEARGGSEGSPPCWP